MYRIPIWISCMVSENSWNKHGGATIITRKQGKKVLDYTLTTPEIFNVLGQVMRSDAEREWNESIKAELDSIIGPAYKGFFSTLEDVMNLLPKEPEPIPEPDVQLVISSPDEQETIHLDDVTDIKIEEIIIPPDILALSDDQNLDGKEEILEGSSFFVDIPTNAYIQAENFIVDLEIEDVPEPEKPETVDVDVLDLSEEEIIKRNQQRIAREA